MTAAKTNEAVPAGKANAAVRSGVRAKVRYVRSSASKARVVLDLIRGKDVRLADQILQLAERDIAIVIRKALASAVANATNNDGLDADELFVSACYADEGPTLKRFRPRARGRAGKINKRTCHITVIVGRMSDDTLERRRAAEDASPRVGRNRRAASSAATVRRERVAASKAAADARRAAAAGHDHDHDDDDHDGHDHGSPDDAHDHDAHDDAAEVLVDAGVVDDLHPYGDDSHGPLEDGSAPEGYDIKGNADSMLYHLPTGRYHEATKAEVWFATEEAAIAAGFSAPGAAKATDDADVATDDAPADDEKGTA